MVAQKFEEFRFVVGRPAIVITDPARIARKGATVPVQLATFVEMRTVDVISSADVALELELVVGHVTEVQFVA